MINTALVYRKTAKGQTEVSSRSPNLSRLARNLLIIIAGKQTAGALIERFRNQGDVDGELTTLVSEGYIEPLDQLIDRAHARPSVAPKAAAPRSAPMSPPAPILSFDEYRRKLARLAYDSLGPGSDAIALRMERATTMAALMKETEHCRNAIGALFGAARAEHFATRVASLRDLPSRSSS